MWGTFPPDENMIEIADRIFYIEAENRGRYPFCHSMFIEDRVSLVIDPACREDIMLDLACRGRGDLVLNTHYHEDHRIFNYCFDGAKLLVHKLDEHGYGSVEHFMSGFSLVKSPSLMEFWYSFLLETCKYRPYSVDATFADNFELNLGNTLLQVVHTPGHSAGHCCFYFPREQALYLGDIDLTSFGPWYASNNSDIDAFLSSIERVRALKPRAVVTSHGDGLVTENIDERLQKYADIIHRRDDLVLDFLSVPRRHEEILGLEIVYRKDKKAPSSPFYWDDRTMIEMHIQRLLDGGRIKRVDNNYSLGYNY